MDYKSPKASGSGFPLHVRVPLPAGRTETGSVYLVGDRGIGWRATGCRLPAARGTVAPPRPGLAGSLEWGEGEVLEGLAATPMPTAGVAGEGLRRMRWGGEGARGMLGKRSVNGQRKVWGKWPGDGWERPSSWRRR